MQDYQTNPAGQLRNSFTVINNVRDHCQQPDAKKLLMFALATYSDGKGICWPSNRTLMRVTGKSKRRVQQMLKELESDGELTVLASGAGHAKKRILSLKRYVKVQPATAPLNVQPFLGKTGQNNHSEQPVHFSKEKSTPHLLRKVRRFPFFEGEEFLSEEERNAVHYYNKKLKRRGWLPVTKLSPEVEAVLEIFEPEGIIELVDYVLQHPDAPDLPTRRTLVRLCWSSY
jgi:hypothetical protein